MPVSVLFVGENRFPEFLYTDARLLLSHCIQGFWWIISGKPAAPPQVDHGDPPLLQWGKELWGKSCSIKSKMKITTNKPVFTKKTRGSKFCKEAHGRWVELFPGPIFDSSPFDLANQKESLTEGRCVLFWDSSCFVVAVVDRLVGWLVGFSFHSLEVLCEYMMSAVCLIHIALSNYPTFS